MKKVLFFSFLCICSFSSVQASSIDVKVGKTSSGIEVWVREDPLTPVISMRFAMDLGTVNDPHDREGTLSVLTKMMQRGTSKISPEKLAAKLQDIVSSYGYNADQCYFYGSFTTLKKYFTEMSSIFKETLLSPLLSQDNLNYVKNQHITGLRVMQSDPGYELDKLVRKTLFKDHPYSRASLGTVESVQKIDLKNDIEKVYKLLNKKGLKVVFVGNIKLEEALKTTEDIFADLPDQSHVLQVTKVTIVPNETVKESSSNPQTLIQYFHKGLDFNDKDFQKLQILCTVLDRLLREKIRDAEGLAYYVNSTLYTEKNYSFMTIITATDSKRATKTIERIKEIIRNLKGTGISEDYFQDAAGRLTGRFVLNFTTTPNIADTLLFLMKIGKDKDYINKRNDLVRSVTFKDFLQFIDSFVQDKNDLFAVYGKLE